MKNFRERLRLKPLSEREELPLLREKAIAARHSREDDLLSVSIPRAEKRLLDTREEARHRLTAEEAILINYDDDELVVTIINLSGGGAMIESDYVPEILEPVLLDLGDGGVIEGATRWVKDGRFGIEFVAETQIGCDPATRDLILLETIRKSFPEANLEEMAAQPSPFSRPVPSGDGSQGADGKQQRKARRHPLVWSAEVHYDHDTHKVRLRNISETGALIDVSTSLPSGAGLLLDLGDAGSFFATVSWSRGGQAGIAFEDKFDVKKLAQSKPQLTSNWEQAEYLKNAADEARKADGANPWSSHWTSPNLSELHDELAGYLKY